MIAPETTFGRLLTTGDYYYYKTCTVYYCVCECGADRWVRSPKLKSGKVTACVYCTAKALVKHKEERSRKVIDLNILTDDQKRLMAYLIRSRVQIKPYNPKRVFIEAYEEARACKNYQEEMALYNPPKPRLMLQQSYWSLFADLVDREK